MTPLLNALPLRDLPGVGYALRRKLEEKGLRTCGDLINISKMHLKVAKDSVI